MESSVLVLDTETTGLSPRRPVEDTEAWEKCRIVQIAWSVHKSSGQLLEKQCYTIKPDGFIIPDVAANIHGITTTEALQTGILLSDAFEALRISMLEHNVHTLVAHNMAFDYPVIMSELVRMSGKKIRQTSQTRTNNLGSILNRCLRQCTMLIGTHPGKRWPKLGKLYEELFGEVPMNCHRADADVEYCSRIYFKLITSGFN